jgi:hypothetical protein
VGARHPGAAPQAKTAGESADPAEGMRRARYFLVGAHATVVAAAADGVTVTIQARPAAIVLADHCARRIQSAK